MNGEWFSWQFKAVLFYLGTLVVSASMPVLAAPPLLPRSYVDTTMPVVSSTLIKVANGGNLQTAINTAPCGSVIALAPGAVFTGNFTLPNKNCTMWTIIRTDVPDSALPPEGVRMTPAAASSANLAKIVTPNAGAALKTLPGASHYRFIGVEITEVSAGKSGLTTNGVDINVNYGLVFLGEGAMTVESDTPQFIVFDRCYFWVRPLTACKRAVELNGRNLAVIDSYLESFRGVNQEVQALYGYNGRGPIKIVNNYLEGAGENIMFGGADPRINNLLTADVEIRGNYLFKPLAWKTPFPIQDSKGVNSTGRWTVKNSFELKNAERVLFEGNVLEHSWADGQTGFSIVLKSANQSGTCTWCTTRDVLLRHNIIKTAAGGSDNIASSGPNPDIPMVRLRYENNLFDNIADPNMGSDEMIQIGGSSKPMNDLAYVHNTMIFARELHNAFVPVIAPSNGFQFSNNIISKGSYGFFLGGAEGAAMLNNVFPNGGYSFSGNVIIKATASRYPAQNFFPVSNAAVGFTDQGSSNYALLPSSPYKNAGTDGKDPGVDMSLLQLYTSGAKTGVWTVPLPPPPPVSVPDQVPPANPSSFTVSGG